MSMLSRIHVTIIMAVSAAAASGQPAATQPSTEELAITGPAGRMVFSTAANRLALVSLQDAKGREWAGPFPEKGSLWKLALRGPEGTLQEVAGGDAVLKRAESPFNHLTSAWTFQVGDRPAVVRLDAVFGKASAAAWELVAELPEGWIVTRVDCPIIANLKIAAGTNLAAPFGWGLEYDAKPGTVYESIYPSLVVSSPFVAFHGDGSGIYLGAFDRSGRIRHLAAKVGPDAGSFACTHWPVEKDTENGRFVLGWEGVFRGFEGDGWGAAQVYRELLETAPWQPKQTLAGRDIPAWLKDVDLWLMPSPEPLKNVEACRKAKEFFGVPVGLHWYNWHAIPFDTLYPEYFPTKPDFIKGVKALQEAGLRVMPYINGRLCDPASRTWIDEHADRSAARREDGSFYTEVYGSKVPLNVMCPATVQWREKIAGIVDRLVNECGVDGVYIDQIGAAAAVRCYAVDHGHSPGGGDFWVQGYRRMLADIRARLPEGRILTTEENAECWNDQLDALLMVNTPVTSDRRIIPLMPAVYGDRVLTFGFQYIAGDDLPRSLPFRAKMARAFIFGSQLGWVSVDAIMADAARREAEFLRSLARCRRHGHEFFLGGQFMGEVQLRGDNPRLKVAGGPAFGGGGGYSFELPAVLASAWATANAHATVMANLSNEPRIVLLAVPKEVGSGGGTGRERELFGPEGLIDTKVVEGGDIRVSIPAREARIVRMAIPTK